MLVTFGFLGITYRSSFYPHTEGGRGGGGAWAGGEIDRSRL